MPLLALETTTFSGSLAILRADGTMISRALPPGKRSAQCLAPAIVDLLRDAELRPNQIDAVAVVQGPGSFTGLRIGITTARMFAYAVGAKLIGIDTHDLLARQVQNEQVDQLEIVIDAQREEFCEVRFEKSSARSWRRCGESRIVSQAEFLARIDPATLVSGPGLLQLDPEELARLTTTDRNTWNPRAETAARLAAERIAAGESDDLYRLVPQYMRVSYAEEKTIRSEKPAP